MVLAATATLTAYSVADALATAVNLTRVDRYPDPVRPILTALLPVIGAVALVRGLNRRPAGISFGFCQPLLMGFLTGMPTSRSGHGFGLGGTYWVWYSSSGSSWLIDVGSLVFAALAMIVVLLTLPGIARPAKGGSLPPRRDKVA